MGTQEYRANYRLAMQEANSHLAELFREFEQLQLRQQLLEDVLGALQPFLESNATFSYDSPRQESARPEPVSYEPQMTAPVAAVPVATASDSARTAPFPAASDLSDPIQNRINRALGLAVA
jgi:2-phospho-L-lactate guanylyltransferase (CobY/MobA/RfbA family)